jgi:hypothetical protein
MSQRLIAIFLLAAGLLSGCAYQGVITEKRFRPLPFYESLGVDAIYNFQLRDDAGAIHSQMVTPEVFASYRVGDLFNDLQPPPMHEGKEMPGFRMAPPELIERPYQPVRVMLLEPQPRTRVAAAVVSERRELPPATAAAATKPAVATAPTKKAAATLPIKSKAKVAAHAQKKSTTKSKIAKVHRRPKHAAKIAQGKHHSRKRVKISDKHRTRPHSKVIASNNV